MENRKECTCKMFIRLFRQIVACWSHCLWVRVHPAALRGDGETDVMVCFW